MSQSIQQIMASIRIQQTRIDEAKDLIQDSVALWLPDVDVIDRKVDDESGKTWSHRPSGEPSNYCARNEIVVISLQSPLRRRMKKNRRLMLRRLQQQWMKIWTRRLRKDG